MPDSEGYDCVDGSVSDGDTLRVRRGDEQCAELRIRLCGIDAPEKDQAVGIVSRPFAGAHRPGRGRWWADRIAGGGDQYGRTVAEILVPLPETDEGIHLTTQMVRDGYTDHYDRDS